MKEQGDTSYDSSKIEADAASTDPVAKDDQTAAKS